MKLFFLFIGLFLLLLLREGFAFKVAIVGQGIAGASCASKLREIFGSDVELSAFDANPAGGRAQTIELRDGSRYEAGASIIHNRNRHLQRFVQDTNLTKCTMDESILAIFNGDKPVFVGSSNPYWNGLKLLWRYNIDLIRIERYVSRMLDDFDKIYRLQEENHAFADINSLLKSWNPKFHSMLNVSLAEHLRQDGFSDRFIDELVNAATRCNYNQRADNLHAFVGSVALAGFLPGLFYVKEGNFQVPSRLFKAARVKMHNIFVTAVERTKSSPAPSFDLHFQNGSRLEGFDFVVLTAPRYPNSTTAWPKLINIPSPAEPFPYQPVSSTFVKGRLNEAYFHLPGTRTPYAVLTTGSAKTDPVSAVAASFPVGDCGAADQEFVWKVFSSDGRLMTDKLLAKVFEERSEVRAKLWSGAYPHYSVPQETAGLRFQLAPGLIVTSPMEALASALEMGAISGVNAALLIRSSRVPETAPEQNAARNEL